MRWLLNGSSLRLLLAAPFPPFPSPKLSGGSGTMRERRQPGVETQRLLANDAGSGVSGGSSSRSHGGSPPHGHVLPANGSASPLVVPSVPGASAVVSNGSGGGGGSGFREESGVRRLP